MLFFSPQVHNFPADDVKNIERALNQLYKPKTVATFMVTFCSRLHSDLSRAHTHTDSRHKVCTWWGVEYSIYTYNIILCWTMLKVESICILKMSKK